MSEALEHHSVSPSFLRHHSWKLPGISFPIPWHYPMQGKERKGKKEKMRFGPSNYFSKFTVRHFTIGLNGIRR